jgi:hypothetical protein
MPCSNAAAHNFFNPGVQSNEVDKVRHFYTTSISFLAQYIYCRKLFMSNSLAPYILPKEDIAHSNTLFVITLIHTIAENLRREKKVFCNFKVSVTFQYNPRLNLLALHVPLQGFVNIN